MRNGVYEFDAARIGEAHQWNQERAFKAIAQGRSPIVIDNTNLEAWEPVRTKTISLFKFLCLLINWKICFLIN